MEGRFSPPQIEVDVLGKALDEFVALGKGRAALEDQRWQLCGKSTQKHRDVVVLFNNAGLDSQNFGSEEDSLPEQSSVIV